MSRLTTVATFDEAVRAQFARNLLAEAGIEAVVTDQEIVAMDWLLSNSVGGIKVQVREEDAERAAAVLDEKLGDESGLAAEGLDEDELTRQALAARADEPPEPEESSDESPTDEGDETGAAAPESPPGGEREEYARRLFYTAVFSLVFFPLWFYALYLLLNATFGEGPLSNHGRRRLWIGGLVIVAPLLLFVLAFTGRLGDWFSGG